MTDKIFVQIPAYRDQQLVSTIDSLLNKAQDSKNLNLWICWQHSVDEALPKRILSQTNINIIDVDYKKSKGAGWARSQLQKQWNNEPYSLLIDSHTRFVEGWDKQLIEMLVKLKNKGVAKPIISTLPPAFYNPNTYPLNRVDFPTKIYPRRYEYGMLIRFNGHLIPLSSWLFEPIPAQFIAMGFLFTEGIFNIEIPFDPKIYFFGDDITTALRAYCHGYDLFHPHKVLAWHLYDRGSRITHWDNNPITWSSLNIKSLKRVHSILRGNEFDKYTIGRNRSLHDYQEYIGYKVLEHE